MQNKHNKNRLESGSARDQEAEEFRRVSHHNGFTQHERFASPKLFIKLNEQKAVMNSLITVFQPLFPHD